MDKWIISTERTLLSRSPGIKCLSQSNIFYLKGLPSFSNFPLFCKSESGQTYYLCSPKVYTDPKGKNKYCLWMRGSFLHKDCFYITGNYIPNTTKEWLHVQSELPKIKKCNLKKEAFTLNMIMFIKKKTKWCQFRWMLR